MKKTIKTKKKNVSLSLPKIILVDENPSGLREKMNKEISIVIVLIAVAGAVVFFGGWAVLLNGQIEAQEKNAIVNKFSKEILREKVIKEKEKLPQDKVENKDIRYANKEVGFELFLPGDGKRYMVKEIEPKGAYRAILFGLPTSDSEIIKIKKADYSEIFRIELVPITDLEEDRNKICADKSRQFPLCDNDDRELGRNARFVFVYTRYDKLDAVEKGKTRLIPNDFDSSVFARADEIVESFHLINSLIREVEEKKL
jgi:hypothetical protein